MILKARQTVNLWCRISQTTATSLQLRAASTSSDYRNLAERADRWAASRLIKGKRTLIEATGLVKALGQIKDGKRIWKTYQAVRKLQAPDLPFVSTVVQVTRIVCVLIEI